MPLDGPIRLNFELHPKQSVAFHSDATEILYGGAAGGGKSHLFRIFAIYLCLSIPGIQVYFFRRMSDDLTRNHMDGVTGFPALLRGLVDAGHCLINSSKGDIKFRNGAAIHMRHCQLPKHLEKYQGAEIHVLIIDELTQWPKFMYAFLRSRVRLGALHIPPQFIGRLPKILCGTNPGGIGHNWVKADFIDHTKPLQIRQMPADEGGMLRQYVPALVQDNPTLMDNDPTYIDKLKGLGNPELVRAMLHGDWDIVAGGMFDDVWRRDIHILKPFAMPSAWTFTRSFDWGSSRPFSVGWWAESDGTPAKIVDSRGQKVLRYFSPGTLIRFHEWYGWNGKPNEGVKMLASDIAKGILELEQEMQIAGLVQTGVADPAIFSVENGNCIADDMANEGVPWIPAETGKDTRVQGWETMRKMLSASHKTPMEEPGLFVFESCDNFIRTIPVLPRHPVKMDDVDTASEDHIADETRYRCFSPRLALSRQHLAI